MAAPRDPEPTRDRLITAATRLFGENGIESTSLRVLTEAAGANIAAVNYHFGSKDGLLRAVVDRTMTAVNDERARRLDAIEATGEPPSVATLVRAFVEPAAPLPETHGGQGKAVSRFIGRVIGEADPRIRQLFADQVDPVEGRFRAALARALPDLDEGSVHFAYINMLGLLASYQSGAFAEIDYGQAPHRGDERELLVRFIIGGMNACRIPPGGL